MGWLGTMNWNWNWVVMFLTNNGDRLETFPLEGRLVFLKVDPSSEFEISSVRGRFLTYTLALYPLYLAEDAFIDRCFMAVTSTACACTQPNVQIA